MAMTGLVKDDGKHLRVFTTSWWKDGELKVAKESIESRTLSKISIMPDGQEATMSLSYMSDRKFRGRVTYVYPTVDEKTRTVRVRIDGVGRTSGETAAVAVLCLAFPLHPPGKPEKTRLAELDGVTVPTLVVQG